VVFHRHSYTGHAPSVAIVRRRSTTGEHTVVVKASPTDILTAGYSENIDEDEDEDAEIN
jgi:hypothetical protein